MTQKPQGPNQWMRLWTDWAHDPKVQRLSEVDQRRHAMVLLMKCEGMLPASDSDVAFYLRIDETEWERSHETLMKRGLVTACNDVETWVKRQGNRACNAKSSTERVQKHRAKKHSGSGIEDAEGNGCNGDETLHETPRARGQNRTEQNRTEQRREGNVSPPPENGGGLPPESPSPEKPKSLARKKKRPPPNSTHSNAPVDGRGRSPGKPEGPPHPGDLPTTITHYQRTVAWWHWLYYEWSGSRMEWLGKHGAQMKRLLKKHGGPAVADRLIRYFGRIADDPFHGKRGADFLEFVGSFDALAGWVDSDARAEAERAARNIGWCTPAQAAMQAEEDRLKDARRSAEKEKKDD